MRDFPAQMGAGSATVELHGRGQVRGRLAAPDVGRSDEDPLLPGGDRRRGTPRPSATTTSGGSPRPTTPTAAPTRCTATSATARCSGPVRPGRTISPNLAGRDAAALAEASSSSRPSDPGVRQPLPAGRRAHLRPGRHAPSGNLLTVIPFSFYPETEWRSDLELGAAELYFATAGGGLPPALPHTDPMFYLQQAAHWANAYITGPDDAADTLNLYDVSGLAHYELYRAIDQAGNPPGSRSPRPRCWPT